MSEESRSFSGEYEDIFEGHYERFHGEKIDHVLLEEQVDSETPEIIEITQETLKRIQRELCLIKLSWPKIEIEEESEYSKLAPVTYSRNSQKEKLLLWYAENFRRQYHTIYKNRKPLLLACNNECGIQKFVSTTIRRSTLSYLELSTWQGCTKFVSDYVDYVPLELPLVMPDHLRSPTWLTILQRGNSFECATLLVSFLLGQGYNAYVVSGYASREQVERNMTKRSFPYLPQDEKPPKPTDSGGPARYQLKRPPEFRSQFLREMEAEVEKARADELQKEEDERQRKIEEFERPPFDMYHGFRIHSWVIILPDYGGPRSQEVLEPLFIEPSSGVWYSPTDPEANLLYLGVESIWNDRNYWVNMQVSNKACAEINWDLTKNKFWEHLLPGEPWWMRGIDDSEQDEEIGIQQEKHLDMPGSYVNEIEIHSLDFERRYPNGKKTTFYKKAKVERIAPYFNTSGLIERVTLYDDYEYIIPTKIYEKYSFRLDNLFKSEKELNSNIVIYFYNRGRPDACKEYHYDSKSCDNVDDERIIEYYDVVRLDGLSKIQMHPNFLIQEYRNREDFLYNREVHFYSEKKPKVQCDIHHRTISKIIERYHRNVNIPASKNIAIREFAINENEIRLKFHFEQGRYTRATRTFIKPSMAARGDRLTLNPEMVFEYNPDPLATPEKSLVLFYDLQHQLEEEEKSIIRVRDVETEINKFIKTRSEEIMMPKLSVSLFDKNRNEKARAEILQQEQKLRAECHRQAEETVDYLAPYIEALGNPSSLTKEQAYQVKQEFLNDFKLSQVERANYMLRILNEENQELHKLQAYVTQTADLTLDEKERLRAQVKEISMYLHTLEERLNRHRDHVPERYRHILNVLRKDQRIRILQ